MANFYDISSLASKLAVDIRNAIMKEAFDACKNALIDQISRTVYTGKPAEYVRTMELLKAVDITNISVSGGQASFTLLINATKLGVHIRHDTWNAHADFKGNDVRESIPLWLDEGTNNKYYSHEAHGFFDKTYDQLDTQLVGVMVRALRSKGWDASVI